MGAGAGLPSLIASLRGAKRVIVTDYPDEDLISNIQYNIDLNIPDNLKQNIIAKVSQAFPFIYCIFIYLFIYLFTSHKTIILGSSLGKGY